ncbi:MAG: hypothetical protein AAB423_01870 [Patescibacteria group bacterium]
MKNIMKNQKGFAVVETTLLSLILLILIGLTIFVVRQNQKVTFNNNQSQASNAKGIEGITNKGLEEELKIEDDLANKDASLVADEIKISSDLEGAYEADF